MQKFYFNLKTLVLLTYNMRSEIKNLMLKNITLLIIYNYFIDNKL